MRSQPQATIIVLSHLRWNFVYQRPQHLLSRLAKQRRVLFVEEPLYRDAEPGFELVEVQPDITVLRCHTPVQAPGFGEEQIACMKPLIRRVVEEQGFGQHILWFYTPMALPIADVLRPEAIVYDCMDELSAFLNAPAELIRREEELLHLADLVFTGGPSLYHNKRQRHPRVYCFPSSIDVPHFDCASKDLAEPGDQAGIPHPRLGFFGVIDERLDTQLVDELARIRPGWQIVMVGPVIKIDPGRLPRRENIHYLGGKQYDELPAYLKYWDVCLLPFARNESTRYISPTKTLEYLAADKPIVSTPIQDVIDLYGAVVNIAASPAEFAAACERVLAGHNHTYERRKARLKILAGTSWNQVATSMELLLESVLRRNRSPRRPLPSRDPQPLPEAALPGIPLDAPGKSARAAAGRVAVIGAGPTGLSAAYHLGERALLLEQNSRVGGLCRSIQTGGFTFDYAGHIMFSNEPYVHKLYKMLLGDNVHWQEREAWIYSKGVHTRYPFQGALYGLPPEVVKECLVGAIEARFGSLKGPNGHSSQPQSESGLLESRRLGAGTNGNGKHSGQVREKQLVDCCGDGIVPEQLRDASAAACSSGLEKARSFEDFIYQVWGAGIARHFAIPYNRKLWAVPLDQMETSWLGGRVPIPDLEEMIDGALRPVPKPMGPNARFGYPLKGGFQALMDGFLPLLQGQLMLNARVVSIRPDDRQITLSDGRTVAYDCLISTMPLPGLIGLIHGPVPSQVRSAAAGLRHVSVRCVHLGVGRENLTEKHWVYYPESTVFHRIFFQGNASPHCNPPGGFGLTCEITYSKHKPLPSDGDDLIRRCVEDCVAVGVIKKDDPIWTACQIDLPYAYVVYDHQRSSNVAVVRNWLAENRIILAGRYAEWEYYNSDHAFISGKKAAERALEFMAQEDPLVAAGPITALNGFASR